MGWQVGGGVHCLDLGSSAVAHVCEGQPLTSPMSLNLHPIPGTGYQVGREVAGSKAHIKTVTARTPWGHLPQMPARGSQQPPEGAF